MSNFAILQGQALEKPMDSDVRDEFGSIIQLPQVFQLC